MALPNLLFVVCTNNRFEACNKIVLDLLKQIVISDVENSIRILIVDNGSTSKQSDLYKTLSSLSKRITCINLKYGGLSYARNMAISLASSNSFIYFLDDDIRIEGDFVENLIFILRKHNPDFLGGPVHSNFPKKLPKWIKKDWFQRDFTENENYPKRISGGNFGISYRVTESGYRFDENLGMKKNKIRMGEEKDFLEVYLATVVKPRILYTKRLRVWEDFDDTKLRFLYRLRREFAIGYADHANHKHGVTKKFYRSYSQIRISDFRKSFIYASRSFNMVEESLMVPGFFNRLISYPLIIARLYGLFLRKLRWHA